MKAEIINKNEILNKKVGKYLPIIILEIFINIGYLLYRISPWKFPFRNDVRTLVFVLLVDIFLLGGYIIAVKWKKEVYSATFETKYFYKYALIIGTIFFVPTCYYKTGYLFPPIIETFTNYGATYFNILNKIQSRPDTGLFTNFIGAFYWVSYVIFPLTYYYWDKLKLKYKILGSLLSVGYILIELCTGKNLGTVILALTLVILYFVKVFQPDFVWKSKKAIGLTSLTIMIALSIAFLFNINLSARTGYSTANEEAYSIKTENAQAALEAENTTEVVSSAVVDEVTETVPTNTTAETNTNSEATDVIDAPTKDFIATISDPIPGSIYYGPMKDRLPDTDLSIDKLQQNYKFYSQALSDYYLAPSVFAYVHVNDPIYKALPEKLRFFYSYGSFYLSHGYTGLSLALYQPWDCTFGLSHLKFIDYYLVKFIDTTPITSKSYEAKLIKGGWNVGNYWMTVYPQFASDFSWTGTVLIMGLMGWLLGTLWIEALYGKNVIAILLLPFYCIQFFFFTSWWFAGLTGGYFILFYGLLFLWILTKIIVLKKRGTTKNSVS